MLNIYIQESPRGENFLRICDFSMAVMCLSYVYEINTPGREQIFTNILINNEISQEEDNLFLDVEPKMLYEGILQFAGCIQKVCSMSYWS